MDEDVIVDLKQFIASVIIQQTSDIRQDITGIRDDLQLLNGRVGNLEGRIGSLERKVEDGFSAIAEIVEAIDISNDAHEMATKGSRNPYCTPRNDMSLRV